MAIEFVGFVGVIILIVVGVVVFICVTCQSAARRKRRAEQEQQDFTETTASRETHQPYDFEYVYGQNTGYSDGLNANGNVYYRGYADGRQGTQDQAPLVVPALVIAVGTGGAAATGSSRFPAAQPVNAQPYGMIGSDVHGGGGGGVGGGYGEAEYLPRAPLQNESAPVTASSAPPQNADGQNKGSLVLGEEAEEATDGCSPSVRCDGSTTAVAVQPPQERRQRQQKSTEQRPH